MKNAGIKPNTLATPSDKDYATVLVRPIVIVEESKESSFKLFAPSMEKKKFKLNLKKKKDRTSLTIFCLSIRFYFISLRGKKKGILSSTSSIRKFIKSYKA